MAASRAQQAQTAERRAQAIQLRLSGMDWETIAQQLGYANRAAACKDVSRALEASREAARKAGEDLRALELARLDRMQAALWARVLKGDTKAADTVLRLMQRRARLAGLEAEQSGGSEVDRWLDSMGVA